MSLAVISRGPKLVSASPTRQAALTVFPRGKEGHSPHPSQQVAREKDKTLDSTNSETTISQTRSWLIKAIENTVIEPRCRQVVIGKVDTEKGESLPSLVCMEPVMVPIQGVHPARVLTRVQTRSRLRLTSLQGHTVSEAPRNCAYVIITNFSNEALTVPKATVLGIAEEISVYFG